MLCCIAHSCYKNKWQSSGFWGPHCGEYEDSYFLGSLVEVTISEATAASIISDKVI